MREASTKLGFNYIFHVYMGRVPSEPFGDSRSDRDFRVFFEHQKP
jgi:hypothetical protein